jgi:Fuc2NAc and GlcNAc transferase
VGLVWVLNLFNFMDGIDGIAGSEAVFIGLGGAALVVVANPDTYGTVLGPSLALAAACGGFLVWNWPPAKIFMGDVGSGFIGCVIAILAIAAARENSTALLLWLILGGVFFVDATITLARRVARGESAHEPHRTHAYQWLARRWNNHKTVTLAVIAVNSLWLMPCALAAALYPAWSSWLAILALAPLIGAALLAGAGRPETR